MLAIDNDFFSFHCSDPLNLRPLLPHYIRQNHNLMSQGRHKHYFQTVICFPISLFCHFLDRASLHPKTHDDSVGREITQLVLSSVLQQFLQSR